MFPNSMIFMRSTPCYRILSYPINAATPVYGSTPLPTFTSYRQIAEGDISNSCIISMHNHTGTHIDSPKHFIDNGRSISEYTLDELTFKSPVIVECPKDKPVLISRNDLQHAQHQLRISDCLLLHTGFGRFRKEEKYRTHNPGIAPETILWIRKEYPDIQCIGIDCISISSFQHRNEGREAHRAAFIERMPLGKPLLIIEDMNLDIISGEIIETMIVLPWQIDGLDSAPCNIIASNRGKV